MFFATTVKRLSPEPIEIDRFVCMGGLLVREIIKWLSAYGAVKNHYKRCVDEIILCVFSGQKRFMCEKGDKLSNPNVQISRDHKLATFELIQI